MGVEREKWEQGLLLDFEKISKNAFLSVSMGKAKFHHFWEPPRKMFVRIH